MYGHDHGIFAIDREGIMTKKIGVLSVGSVNLAASIAATALSSLTSEYTDKLADFKSRLQSITSPMAMPSPADMSASMALNLATYDPAKIVALMASLVPALSSAVVTMTAKLSATKSALGNLLASMAIGGVYVYTFEGQASAIGADVQAIVSADHPSPTPLKAVVLVTNSEAAWTALKATIRAS